MSKITFLDFPVFCEANSITELTLSLVEDLTSVTISNVRFATLSFPENKSL